MDKRQANTFAASPGAAAGTGGLLMPRLVGAGMAGVAELSIFHPVDTVAKRLMTSTATLSAANVNQVIFRNESASFASRVGSLFPGLGFAGLYKITQRSYKFGLQPFVYNLIDNSRVGAAIESKPLKSAVAGACLGLGEVALLPLDVLKIKAQTNPASLQKRSLVEIITKEGSSLYRGASWTAARNVPGSFALFGGNSFAKQAMGVNHGEAATVTQTTISSMAGAIASLAVSQPLDVVKTRIQSRSFSGPAESGANIVKEILVHEGPGAFFKGFTPKVMAVGPKLIFSFTVAQQLIQVLEQAAATTAY